MSRPIAVADFESAEVATLELMLAQAQERLKQQVQLAQGADSRAQGILSVASGFAAAGFSGSVVAWDGAGSHFAPLPLGALVAGLFWVFAAAGAMRAMSPVDIDAPGWPPSWLAGDLRAHKGYHRIVSEVLVQLDVMISANRRVMRENARWTRRSILLLMVAPALGLLAAVAAALGSALAPPA